MAWASCQPYLPCAGLAIAVDAGLFSRPGRRPATLGWLLVSAGLYAAALGFKAVAVGLPIVLLILDVAVLGRAGGGRLALGVWVESCPSRCRRAAYSWPSRRRRADAC